MDEVEEFITQLVIGGYQTRTEILEGAIEVAADEEPGTPNDVVEALVDRIIREHAATGEEYAKFRASLTDLEANGILAREDYWCCQTCGFEAICQEMTDAEAAGRRVDGFVYFHQQDTARLASGALMLRFGSRKPRPGENPKALGVAVGHRVVEALRRHHLAPNWNGDLNRTIELGIAWDKPMPDHAVPRQSNH